MLVFRNDQITQHAHELELRVAEHAWPLQVWLKQVRVGEGARGHGGTVRRVAQ